MQEGSILDYKSLKALTVKPDWDEIAKDCVAFANASGGRILFGIENQEKQPADGQIVPGELPDVFQKTIQHLTINVQTTATIRYAENDAEYLEVFINRAEAIAGTTKGRYFVRIGDESSPVHPDELYRLMTDKGSFNWEMLTNLRINSADCDQQKKQTFLQDIRSAPNARVSSFIKAKSDQELLEYYNLIKGALLTNLGILWIGTRQHRAELSYAPSMQFIKYDAFGEKVHKLTWDDYTLNPKELIEAVWNSIPDWKEGIEVADGLFRKKNSEL